MVSHAENPENPSPEAKPLQGVGIVIVEEIDGTKKTLGVCFAPNITKLNGLLQQLTGNTSMRVKLADVRGGSITLDHQ